MYRDKAIRVLEAELACVSRDCDRDCGKCDLVMDKDWLIEGLTDAIALLKEQENQIDKVEYKSNNGFRGVLYDMHDWHGEKRYQMSIYNMNGSEILHSYNATPKTLEELKAVVDEHPSFVHFLMNMAKEIEQ